MQQYLDLLRRALDDGEPHQDRTGVGTLSLFGESLTFDVCDGEAFPLMTTKRMPFKTVVSELLWFLSGSSDIRDLWKRDVHIWDDNYEAPAWQHSRYFETFSLGRIYGPQWRCWNGGSLIGVDQIDSLLESLTQVPESRRHLVTAWNPYDLSRQALPPCHVLFQIKVHTESRQVSMSVYMRSCDIFLGCPFNIASYAALLLLLARVTGYRAHRLIMFFGDIHLYNTHREAASLQLERLPHALPRLVVPPRPGARLENLLSYRVEDLRLEDYVPHKRIMAPMAV